MKSSPQETKKQAVEEKDRFGDESEVLFSPEKWCAPLETFHFDPRRKASAHKADNILQETNLEKKYLTIFRVFFSFF